MNPTPLPFVSVPTPDVAPALTQMLNALIGLYPDALAFIKSLIGILIGISLPLSVLFVIVIVYCVEQLKRIRKKEEEKYEAKVVPAYETVADSGETALAKRWHGAKKHMESDNPNDWRQAIIDADIILDDLLNRMGYRGESVGEKLKHAAKGDFATVEDAWEAHRIRNQIAHEGSGFSLNEHEAKKAFNHYRRVFDEFYYI